MAACSCSAPISPGACCRACRATRPVRRRRAAAALATAGIGALLEMALLRRIYRAPELLQLLATFGVVLMVQDLALLIWGPADLRCPARPWLRGFVVIAAALPAYDLVLIGLGPLVLGLLWLLFARTRWGGWCAPPPRTARWWPRSASISACCSPRCSRSAPGWPGWAARCACRARGQPAMDLTVIVDAFVVVVVGGMGSLPGAFSPPC